MNDKRVISLSPSCTEIIHALGCARQLVGRSDRCDETEPARPLPVCARTIVDNNVASQQFDFKTITALRPDLVFADHPLEIPGVNVILSPASRVMDLWTNFQVIAEALDVMGPCRDAVAGLKNRLVDIIAKTCIADTPLRVVCLEGISPLSTSGRWMPELIEFAGGREVLGKIGISSAPLDWAVLEKADPAVLIIAPRGFDLVRVRAEMALLERAPQWNSLRAVRERNVFLVDASRLCVRPGPSLIDTAEALAEMLLPKEFHYGGEGKRWARWSV